jgi:cobyrinic acid a,c-diamide synthase
MQITRQIVANRLAMYLRHEVSLEQLVDWAELQVMDADFESDKVRNAVARLGVADVRAFGLTWDDCQQLLRDLGFDAQVQIEAV